MVWIFPPFWCLFFNFLGNFVLDLVNGSYPKTTRLTHLSPPPTGKILHFLLQLSENLVCLGFAEQDGVITVQTFSAKVPPAGALQAARRSFRRGGLLLFPLEAAQVGPHQEPVHTAAPTQLWKAGA